MLTNTEKSEVRRLLAEHIGNPAKRAARQRRNHALMTLIAQRHDTGTTTAEAEAEYASANADFQRMMKGV